MGPDDAHLRRRRPLGARHRADRPARAGRPPAGAPPRRRRRARWASPLAPRLGQLRALLPPAGARAASLAVSALRSRLLALHLGLRPLCRTPLLLAGAPLRPSRGGLSLRLLGPDRHHLAGRAARPFGAPLRRRRPRALRLRLLRPQLRRARAGRVGALARAGGDVQHGGPQPLAPLADGAHQPASRGPRAGRRARPDPVAHLARERGGAGAGRLSDRPRLARALGLGGGGPRHHRVGAVDATRAGGSDGADGVSAPALRSGVTIRRARAALRAGGRDRRACAAR